VGHMAFMGVKTEIFMLLNAVIYIWGRYVHAYHFPCSAKLSFESFFLGGGGGGEPKSCMQGGFF
jgi:hypothetical protein